MTAMLKYQAICAAALTVLSAAAEPKLTLTTDRELPIYQCGEQATFTVKGDDDGKKLTAGNAVLTIFDDGDRPIQKITLDFSKESAFSTALTLAEPGFVRAALSAYSTEIPKPKRYPQAGAAFEPEKITSCTVRPDDFMKFWTDGREQAAAAGKVELTELEKKDNVTIYEVAADVLRGEKLYGYLAIPDGEGPFPAYISIPGSGPGGIGPNLELARRGVITIMMNVHKLPGSRDAKELTSRFAEYTKKLGHDYAFDRGDDREQFHFRNVILGIDRVINHVAAMPQYDRRHFVVDGSSQGGGLALIMAGFNPHLSAVAANVPAMCDFFAYKQNRQAGWPQLYKETPNSESVTPYYDVVNFAPYIKIPVLISAGYIDRTCTAATIYAAYNKINAPKRMIDMPRSAHEIPPYYKAEKNPWVDQQLGLGKRVQNAQSGLIRK